MSASRVSRLPEQHGRSPPVERKRKRVIDDDDDDDDDDDEPTAGESKSQPTQTSASAGATGSQDAEESRSPQGKKPTSAQSDGPKKNAPVALTKANMASLKSIKKAKVQPQAKEAISSNSTPKRRSQSPASRLPSAFRRERTPPPPARSPRPIERSPSRSPPRQRKRPGAGARVNDKDAELVRKRIQEREEQRTREAQAEASARGVGDVVRQHYNYVPQRGKEWRRTDSKIKGLRSLNNWIKSAVIQKFSPSESYVPGAREQGYRDHESGLLVLDIGCGKGGDLQKWHAAPQRVALYVGLDPAEVSIQQAHDRFVSMQRQDNRPRDGYRGRPPKRLFDAQFIVKDCYAEWIGDVPIVQQVGIDPAVGPEVAYKPRSGGGFDIVSMMFCLHYAFESEAKARTILRNVAGSLKKGGRFIGVIPNSDVLTQKVADFCKTTKGTEPSPQNPGQSVREADDDDEWDPEKPSDTPIAKPSSSTATPNPASGEDLDEWDPERPSSPPKEKAENGATPGKAEDDGASKKKAAGPEEVLEWGNSLYKVRFPSTTAQPLPANGTFRPPFGWKYFYFLEEAVEEIPEYVVPWEMFRAMALDYDLELQYRRPFLEIWDMEKDDAILGPLTERMGVRERGTGRVTVTDEEWDAIGFYHAFCFYKV